MSYDPTDVEIVEVGPYRFHHLPGRASRPGSWNSPEVPSEGLRRPHRPCPFCAPEFPGPREIGSFRRDRRRYHLICNRYPVASRHWLAVRWGDEDEASLPQFVQGREELEDMILLGRVVDPDVRLYFNSNRGADGSDSGSSINHWHFQLFPYTARPGDPLAGELEGPERAADGVVRGVVSGWPGRHIALEATDLDWRALATALWVEVECVNRANVAYNLELRRTAVDDGVRALLFPRRAAPPVEIPGVGPLPRGFGGWELSGDFVIPSREMLDWLVRHPDAAVELSTRRLAETTRWPV